MRSVKNLIVKIARRIYDKMLEYSTLSPLFKPALIPPLEESALTAFRIAFYAEQRPKKNCTFYNKRKHLQMCLLLEKYIKKATIMKN